MRSTSAGEFFETNEKMVLINDDQCTVVGVNRDPPSKLLMIRILILNLVSEFL